MRRIEESQMVSLEVIVVTAISALVSTAVSLLVTLGFAPL